MHIIAFNVIIYKPGEYLSYIFTSPQVEYYLSVIPYLPYLPVLCSIIYFKSKCENQVISYLYRKSSKSYFYNTLSTKQ